MSVNKTELGFKPDVTVYISENLIPFNQRLAWQCREVKRARLIHSCWSSKGVVKIRRTMNERALSVDSEKDLTVLTLILFLWGGMDQSERDQITFKSVIVICFLSFLCISLFVDNAELF